MNTLFKKIQPLVEQKRAVRSKEIFTFLQVFSVHTDVSREEDGSRVGDRSAEGPRAAR